MVPLAALIFRESPFLPPSRVEALEAGARPLDWLVKNYPHGCGARVQHWHNDELVDYASDDYLERPAGAGDVINLVAYPAEPVSITTIIVTALVTAAISAAVSIGLSLLFPDPSVPAAAVADKNNAASPAYNVRSRQNTARLGEPVPVVYGRVLMTPDLCASPYRIFASPRGMYIDMLMCLGQGEFDVHGVLVGESETDQIEGGAAQFIVVPPTRHGGTYGHLNDVAVENGWDGSFSGFIENCWSSLEVGEQRFTNALDSSGWYRVGRAGVSIGATLVVLVEWPRGLYQMPDWGDPVSTECSLDVYAIEADADGQPVPGTQQEFTFSFSGGSLDPRRDTLNIPLGRSAAWLVKMLRRTEQYPHGDEMNEFYWRGLMLHCGGDPSGLAYGDVTLLMVRLHAEQVASTAERLVRVDMTRRLPIHGDPGAGLTATDQPGEAFIDIYCNQVYGGRRPLAELDMGRIIQLENYWASAGEFRYGFRAVYTQRTTVWEAMSQAVQGVAAAPMPAGGLMSIAQDGVRPVRSMLFTEQNIVKGSFTLAYHFEATGAADGIEIEYVDPDTWAPAYVRFPTSSLAPDRMNLFGCADAVQAAQFARLQWQRRQRLRRLVTFSTELEGLIPNPGERIAVAHTLPRWGVSGLVASVADGVNLTLDRELPWADVAAPWYMAFRDQYSGASAIVGASPGSAANQVTLSSSPWGPGQDWSLGPNQERTQFSWGDGERVVKDFTLTSLAPKSGPTVDLSGVVYDPAVYDSTLTFLAAPVP